jgi:hypothetical protein
VVFGWNLPAGTVRVSGSAGATLLKSHDLRSHAGALSLTVIHP